MWYHNLKNPNGWWIQIQTKQILRQTVFGMSRKHKTENFQIWLLFLFASSLRMKLDLVTSTPWFISKTSVHCTNQIRIYVSPFFKHHRFKTPLTRAKLHSISEQLKMCRKHQTNFYPFWTRLLHFLLASRQMTFSILFNSNAVTFSETAVRSFPLLITP